MAERLACCRYWARHACAAWLEVPWYACRAQRWQLLAQCLATEAGCLAAVWLLASWSAAAALWVFIVPYLLTSLALMFGNWWVPLFRSGPVTPLSQWLCAGLKPACQLEVCACSWQGLPTDKAGLCLSSTVPDQESARVPASLPDGQPVPAHLQLCGALRQPAHLQ